MRRNLVLTLLTLAHFSVDGVCGAALAAYAVDELYLEPIVYYFGLYNLIAFGGQWCAGWIFDKSPRFLLPAFLLAAFFLGLGIVSVLPVGGWVTCLGIGNCLFHAAAGSIVLRRYENFAAPGIFVSSGAVGLGLGLGQFVPAPAFFALYLAAALAVFRLISAATEDNTFGQMPEKISSVPIFAVLASAAALLFCVVLRGFGGGGASDAFPMLLPCVFMLGKAAGGVLCDRVGFRRAILAIFLLGFFAVLGEGIFFALLLVFSFNMTMPLTLRLLHWCSPAHPGLMFGLAAGCLLPGAFYPGAVFVPAPAMIVLQFLCLCFAGYWLRRFGRMKKEGTP